MLGTRHGQRMGTLGCRRDPGQGQREGLDVLGGHPNCPLGPADRARDSAGCWGDGAESCETARGKGESMSPGQRAAVPTLHKKSHTAPSKPSSFSPPGGGICERCPACHTLHRVRCLCLHSLQGHQAERRCGTAPGAAGQGPSSAPAALAMRGVCSREGTQLWSCQLLSQGLGRWHCGMEKLRRNVQMKS